jgi:hypothetical protein
VDGAAIIPVKLGNNSRLNLYGLTSVTFVQLEAV